MTGGTGLPRAARIVERIQENPKTASFVLDAPIHAEAGQFVMVWLPGLDEKPFSIAGGDPMMLTVARVGPFSEALHCLGPGDLLRYRGPFGKGFPLTGGRALLVGGGYGAAPLFFLANRLLGTGAGRRESSLTVALGARTRADILFKKRFKALGVSVLVTTEDGSEGLKGLVTAAVKPLLEAGSVDHLYSCGPEKMLEAISALCLANDIRADLSHEAYMRCGIGLCGACERDGRLVCLDGPVFPAGG